MDIKSQSNSEVELAIQSIACRRNNRLLFDRLSFNLMAGQALQVCGHNGSGKSSLLRILAGLLSPAAGRVLWRGQLLRSCWFEYTKNLLYQGHKPGVKLSLTARENLAYLCNLNHLHCSADIEVALTTMQLATYADTPLNYLSAGQCQRVALAYLLLSQAKLWILDEPFTALDTSGVAILSGLLNQHVSAGGLLIFTSHQTLVLQNIKLKRLSLMQ